LLHTQDHSRKQIAELIGVAPETISVWKRHPQWQRELDRWRELAETPLDCDRDAAQARIARGDDHGARAAAAADGRNQACQHRRHCQRTARLANTTEACRLVLAITFAVMPEFQDQYRQTPVDHRTLRLDR
jgi:uncharacterized protein YjcR